MSVRWKIRIISKLVGISEAIRLILIFVKLNLINLTKKAFILIKIFFSLIFYWILILFYNIIYHIIVIIFYFLEIFNIYYCTSDMLLSPADSTNKNTTLQVNNSGNNANTGNDKDLSFNQWLAGLIDGDGYLKKDIIVVKSLWMLEIKKHYMK